MSTVKQRLHAVSDIAAKSVEVISYQRIGIEV